MRSRPDPSRRRGGGASGQRGFTLIEVMAASVVLAVFVVGVSALWQASTNRVTQITQRQKAIFVANAEMERLVAMYSFTEFGKTGPVESGGYTDPDLPADRLVYPNNVRTYFGGPSSDDFVKSGWGQVKDEDFIIYLTQGGGDDRLYVWIDRQENLMGQLSWATSDIVVNACMGGDNCSCHDFDGTDSGSARHCRTLDMYLEYPYRPDSGGSVTPGDTLRTITLSTIVGRL